MDTFSGKFRFDELSGLGITHHGIAHIEDARGATVRVEAGSVWLTQDGSTEDVLLSAGDSYRIEHDGRTLVSTLGRPGIALVSIERDPKEPRPTLWERLRRFLRRLGAAFAPQWETHELNAGEALPEFGTLAALHAAGLSSGALGRMIRGEDRRR